MRLSYDCNIQLDILVQIRFFSSLEEHKPHKGDRVSSLMCPNTSLTCVNALKTQLSIYNNGPSPKKLWSSVAVIPLVQRPPHTGARWELLDLANKEGSGSPHVIFPALICIDFKQSVMSGKQSWPDFEEDADGSLHVSGLFCELG